MQEFDRHLDVHGKAGDLIAKPKWGHLLATARQAASVAAVSIHPVLLNRTITPAEASKTWEYQVKDRQHQDFSVHGG